MSHLLIRWSIRLIFGAMLYPAMQFVVLPMVNAQRTQVNRPERSAWETVSKELSGPKVSGSIPGQSDQKASRPIAERSFGGSSKPGAKITDLGGHQIVISPALKSRNSVQFVAGKVTSNSSANCKPGST